MLDQEDEEELSKIKFDNDGDTDACNTAMFRLWKNRKANASWNQLICALREPSIRLNNLAKKIEGLFTPKGSYIHS